jgi:hypothetical protein
MRRYLTKTYDWREITAKRRASAASVAKASSEAVG